MIIGLLGRAGSGKTTVAEYLERKYGAKSFAFADPLKALVRSAFDLTSDQLYGSQEQKEAIDPRYGVSPRWLLQRIGTEGVQKIFGKDVWIDYTLGRLPVYGLSVISDVRFLREAERVSLVGRVWKINSPHRTEADHTHRSESEIDQCVFDHVIENTGTVEQLYEQVDKLAKDYDL